MTKIAFFILLLLAIQTFGLVSLDDAQTRYPLVLVHGIFGFSDIYGKKYWGDLADTLRFNGAVVYTATISQAHSPKKRGEQIKELLMLWGHDKYHILAHSQGGIDGRYVVGKYPHLIASLTTIATPHYGSKVADAACMIEHFPRIAPRVWAMGNKLCHMISFFAGSSFEQDVREATLSLTTSAMHKFNQDFPLGITVHADASRLYSLGFCCHKPRASDILGISFAVLGQIFYGQEKNDGVVEKSSMRFGTYCGDICGSHHLLPVKDGLGYYQVSTIDKFLTSILNHVQYLKDEGL